MALKDKLNLELVVLDTHNPRLLAIADASVYPRGFAIINPTLQITPPSFQTSTHVLSTNNINMYNTNSLGVTCSDDFNSIGLLPDGIWTLKYSVSPAHENNIEKTFIRVDSLLIKLDEAYLSTDMTECDNKIKDSDKLKIDEIENFIHGAVAAANNCNNELAIKLYNTASKLLKDFTNSKKC